MKSDDPLQLVGLPIAYDEVMFWSITASAASPASVASRRSTRRPPRASASEGKIRKIDASEGNRVPNQRSGARLTRWQATKRNAKEERRGEGQTRSGRRKVTKKPSG